MFMKKSLLQASQVDFLPFFIYFSLIFSCAIVWKAWILSNKQFNCICALKNVGIFFLYCTNLTVIFGLSLKLNDHEPKCLGNLSRFRYEINLMILNAPADFLLVAKRIV